MTEEHWGELLYAIHKGKCLLLLGAGASTLERDGQARPCTEWLAGELAAQLRRDGKPLEESESGSLLYVASEYLRHRGSAIALQGQVEGFYREQAGQPSELLRLIAELPFPLVINTAPDTLLERAWLSLGKDYRKAYYSLRKDRTKTEDEMLLDDPSPDCPLLYNLFGSVEDPGSLVLTERDRLHFIEDVIQNNNAIPITVLKQFWDDRIVLFIGFDFEQWHLRILPLKLFNRDKYPESVLVPNGGQALSAGAMVFYQREYRMAFLPEDPLRFARELHRRWEARPPQADAAPPAALRAIYLYHQEDEPYKQQLDQHLAPLKRHAGIQTWDESMLLPGEEVDRRVREQLGQANLILLLVSSDFLASSKLYDEQLAQALERNRAGQARIIPIILRPCAWESAAFARSKFILPRRGKPITAWENADAAYRHIVQELEKYLPYFIENLSR
jgi:hypothetical protein